MLNVMKMRGSEGEGSLALATRGVEGPLVLGLDQLRAARFS